MDRSLSLGSLAPTVAPLLLVLACGDSAGGSASSTTQNPTGVEPGTGSSGPTSDTPTTGAPLTTTSESTSSASGSASATTTGESPDPTTDTGLGVCVPGTSKCEGQNVKVCADDGGGYVDDGTCDPLLGLQCDPNVGVCVGPCAELSGLSYIGCDYYPVTTQQPDYAISDLNPFAVAVSNTAATDAMVAVHRGDDLIAQVTVPAMSVKIVKLPWVTALTALSGPTKHAKQGAYHLRSNQPVTVYQFNPLNADTSNDASLLLPVNTWSGNYVAVSWPHWADYQYPGFYTVTASQDNTIVKVKGPPGGTPVQAGGGVDATGTGMALLNRGDVLSVVTNTGGDITGSIITADKPVQVIAGHECTQIPFGVIACDHLEETMFPLEVLADQYIVVPPVQVPDSAKEKAIFVRIVATEDNTDLTFEPDQGAPGGLAKAGDFIELPMSTNKYKVSATHKILVAQFMVGQDAGYGTSDPAMVLAVPSIQYRQEYLIYAQPFWKANWVDIIAPKAAKITVDGAPIQNLIPIGTTDYGLAHVKLVNNADGNHTLKSDLEFGIDVYGVLDYGSYWYPGGLDLAFVPPN